MGCLRLFMPVIILLLASCRWERERERDSVIVCSWERERDKVSEWERRQTKGANDHLSGREPWPIEPCADPLLDFVMGFLLFPSFTIARGVRWWLAHSRVLHPIDLWHMNIVSLIPSHQAANIYLFGLLSIILGC